MHVLVQLQAQRKRLADDQRVLERLENHVRMIMGRDEPLEERGADGPTVTADQSNAEESYFNCASSHAENSGVTD